MPPLDRLPTIGQSPSTSVIVEAVPGRCGSVGKGIMKPVANKRRAASSYIPLVFAALFVLFVTTETLERRLPLPVVVIYGLVSILTFLVYRFDKAAAQHGRWRTKESSLLLLGLVGGWPGAVLAQRVLRHKSRKKSFQWAFWGTVVINFVALAWLLASSGLRVLDPWLK